MQKFMSTDGLIYTRAAVRCLVRGCASPGDVWVQEVNVIIYLICVNTGEKGQGHRLTDWQHLDMCHFRLTCVRMTPVCRLT